MTRVCVTDQKFLISYLRRNGDAKVPDAAAEILVRLTRDVNQKTDPSIVDYLINKGNSEDDIASFIGISTCDLDTYAMPETRVTDEEEEERDRSEAAATIIAYFAGGGGGHGNGAGDRRRKYPFAEEEV